MSAPRWRLAAESAVVFALVTALAYFVQRPEAFEPGDEGMRWLLSAAWADGGSLYDRFQPIYPPGQYLFFGTALATLGESLDTLRCAHAALGGVAAVVLFVTLRGLGAGSVAWVAALSLALPLSGTVKMLASMLVLLAALRVAEAAVIAPRTALLLGALAGALAGWREDSAVFAGALTLVALWRARSGRALLAATGGAVGAFALWLLPMSARGDTGEFLVHLVRRLLFLVIRLKRPVRVGWSAPEQPFSNFFAAMQTLLPLLWVLPVAVYLGLLVVAWRRRRNGAGVDRVVVAAALVGCAYLPQFLWERNDLAHAFDHRPILVAVVAVAIQRAGASARRRGFALFALLFAGTLWVYLPSAFNARAGVAYPSAGTAGFGARLAELPPWAPLPREPGETMIVIGWGPGWYALEGIGPGTRFLSSDARQLRWPGSLEQLLADLEAPSNRWVLATPGTEPNAPLFQLLDRRYTLVQSWHAYQLWEHRRAGG